MCNCRARKWVVHLCTRQCEIERLARSYNQGDVHVIVQIERSLWQSRQLQGLHIQLRSPTFDPKALVDAITKIKKINKTSVTSIRVFQPIEITLSHMRDMTRLIILLDEIRAPYDSSKREHETLLSRLWSLLRPNTVREARHTAQWRSIGFQGNDPATDFRGMGLLGLQNLVHFSENYPVQAQAILKCTMDYKNWFSFAITGLNITASLCQLIRERKLIHYFYSKGSTLDSFNQLYAYSFVKLNELWTQVNPDNVMVFQDIIRQFLNQMVEEDRTGFLAEQGLTYDL